MLTSLFFFTLWLAVCARAASHYFSLKQPGDATTPTTLTSTTTNNMAADLATQQRVDFTLGVMSRCPDAIFAESALNSVIEQTNDKISLQFSYIGNLTAQELSIFNEDVGGVYCRHGAQECHGNIHQLCVKRFLRPSRAGKDYDLSPSAAQRKVWDFVQCENYDGAPHIGTDGLAKQCLNVIKGPTWEGDGEDEGIAQCAAPGGEGEELLRQSVVASKKRGIEKSATIQIEGRTICIRDDSQWKSCPGGHETADFVRQIEEAWRSKNGV